MGLAEEKTNEINAVAPPCASLVVCSCGRPLRQVSEKPLHLSNCNGFSFFCYTICSLARLPASASVVSDPCSTGSRV
jgi:hypothetical protein